MRVLGIGYCTLDQIAVVERLPELDQKVEMTTFSVQGGGTTATALAALARWGVPARFAGKTGADDRGRQIERTLANEGVDTAALVRQEGAISQLSFIVVEAGTGRKQTYCTPGSVSALGPDELAAELLDDVDLLVVDGAYPEAQLRLMQAAAERGVPVVLEASRLHPAVDEMVAHCDYIVASERFASRFTGVGQLDGLCRSMLERGPQTVVVTLGDEGSVALEASREAILRQPAYDVPVVDTTGAGDVFLGAFVYGITQDWPLEKTVWFANIAAGLSCSAIGGRGGIPSLEALEQAMER